MAEEFYQTIPEDIKETFKHKVIGLMDKDANFAMNSAAQRFGTYNFGTPEWDKRNAHQHLIWSVLSPNFTKIYEVSNEMTRGEVDNQDIHNNKLKNEVVNRANELDARKGKKGDTPSEGSVEQAAFDMVKEQEKRLEQGLMQNPNLHWVDTKASMPGYTETKEEATGLTKYIYDTFFK